MKIQIIMIINNNNNNYYINVTNINNYLHIIRNFIIINYIHQMTHLFALFIFDVLLQLNTLLNISEFCIIAFILLVMKITLFNIQYY